MKSAILALAGAAFLAGTAASAATLDVVKERGELRCGVSQGVLGFSAPNDKGEWSGFDIDFCGEGTVEVRGTPADMPADAVDRLLFDLLQAFATPVSLSDVRREKIAGVMARSGAKGAGRTLSREEAAALLAQLADTGSFSFSPSGKAITAEITPEDLRAKLG